MFEFDLVKKEEEIKEVLFTANTADPTFYRTYSRLKDEGFTKESAGEVFKRGLDGIFKLGNYTEKEKAVIIKNLYSLKTFFSGRWLWVGGKEFLDKPKNYYASYNCIGMSTESLKDFSRAFNFLMQGCGVGASITLDELKTLSPIINTVELLDITLQDDIGSEVNPDKETTLTIDKDNLITLKVGDTREGWNEGFLLLLELFTNTKANQSIKLKVDLTNPRKKGTPIKGFGGVANPSDLRNLFIESIDMLNKYVGKAWDSYLAAWLYGRVAKTTVAG